MGNRTVSGQIYEVTDVDGLHAFYYTTYTIYTLVFCGKPICGGALEIRLPPNENMCYAVITFHKVTIQFFYETLLINVDQHCPKKTII